MASENETVAAIVREMRVYAKKSKINGGEIDVWNWLAHFADRIEAAHNRELAAKDDERLTIVANYENVIAAKDAEIAELRECLKEAIREKCPFTRMSCKHDEPCDYECGTKKWRKALKGVKAGRQPVTDCNCLGNAAKDAEIAELRRRLKVAEDALTELQARCVVSVHDGTIDPYEALKIAEDALAAIRKEGGSK